MAGRVKYIVNYVRLLTVEPLAFFVMFIHLMKRLPQDQLAQDKICLQKYNLNMDYCKNLPTMNDTTDYLHVKSDVLGDVTQFNMYISILTTIPIIGISVMIGPFIDKYKPAKKILLILASSVSLLEYLILVINSYFFSTSYYLLILSHIVNASCGGPLVALTTIWSYLSAVTPAHMRSIRMTTIEIFIAISTPLATAAGGNLLTLHSPFATPHVMSPAGEPRNYTTIFLTGCFCSFLMLLISILLVDEEKDRELFHLYFPVDSKVVASKRIHNMKGKQLAGPEKTPGALAILFDWRNVKDTLHTFTKSRPHHIRLHIILSIFASMALLLAHIGPNTFMYQYVQKVFAWNSSQYSNYVTASSLVNILTTFILAPVIIKIFKITDLNYSLIALHCFFMQNILRLVSKSVWTFYAALPFYVVNSIGMVGIRSYLTKIVEPNELGRVYSLMSAIDASLPVVSSLIFTPLFRRTIDTMPNLSFSAVCVGLAAGIMCLYVAAYQSKKTLERIESDRKSQSMEKTHEKTHDISAIS